MGVEVLVPLGVFLMVVLIVSIPAYFKSREKREMQATVRAAIAQGQSLPPELIESLTQETVKKSSGHRDLRVGVIWLAIAIGISILAWMIGFEEGEAVYPLIGMAAIPGCIGVAFIILSVFNKNKG